jgi:leukotriene-A4 hydrolase
LISETPLTPSPLQIEYDTSLADNAYDLAARWDAARSQSSFPKFSASDVEGWTSNQVSMLLDTLHKYEPFPESAVEAVQKAYGVNETSNPEIKLRWLLFALKSGFYKEEAAKWVQTVGRMKYCRPSELSFRSGVEGRRGAWLQLR